MSPLAGAAEGGEPGEDAVRCELAEVCRLLYDRGLVTSVAGNVSVRSGQRVLITPTGVSLRDVTPEAGVLVDMEGRALAGGRPSSELDLHLAVYRAAPRVRAVVHTHSPAATALALAGEALEPATTEAEMLLGRVPLVPYAPPGSRELAAAVAPYVEGSAAVLLQRHGVVAWGSSLTEAFYRAELVEETARVAMLAALWRLVRGAGGVGDRLRG